IGGAAGVASFLQRIGIGGLYPNPYAWGWCVITPWTMSSHPHWEGSGQEYDQHPINDQPYARELADLPTNGQRFLSEDQRRHQRHHRNIHDAERKEDYKQEPAAPEAVDSMLQPHAEGSTIPIVP